MQLHVIRAAYVQESLSIIADVTIYTRRAIPVVTNLFMPKIPDLCLGGRQDLLIEARAGDQKFLDFLDPISCILVHLTVTC